MDFTAVSNGNEEFVTFSKEEHLHLPLAIDVLPSGLVTTPFPLFKQTTLDVLRDIIAGDETHEYCVQTSKLTPVVHRGLTFRSKFIRDLVECPDIVDKVSEKMGAELMLHPQRFEALQFNRTTTESIKNQRPTFTWHYDSQPYVMIVLISEPADDGDSYTKYRLDGEEHCLTFPAAGYAYIIRGDKLEHMVANVTRERISMIFTFVFKSPFAEDSSNMVLGVQYTPSLLALYSDFINYRMQRIREINESDHAAEEKKAHIARHLHFMQVETDRFRPKEK